MPFVKLDAGILTSTLWEEPDATKLVFLTALLMAGPYEVTEPMKQLEIRSLKTTSFVIPPGWYGFIAAAGIGIIRQARVEPEPGLTALEKLGDPDPASRSSAFEGRRLVRVEGGFVVLNFFKYRDRDYSAAERMRKLRARKAEGKSASDVRVCSANECNVRPNVTHSRGQSAEAETEKIKTSSPELILSSDHTPEPTPPGVEEGLRANPTPKATASSSVIPDWIPAEAWAGFVEMRKRLRSPMTTRAVQLLIIKLAELRTQGEDVGAVLDQSTQNSWKGVFSTKGGRARSERHTGFEQRDYKAGLTKNDDGSFQL
jgi:hypothetical protein